MGSISTTVNLVSFNFTLATIRALAKLVQVLGQHRFCAVILILLMVTTGALMAVSYPPAILA